MPFAAIKSFFDPSVQFGLQFETADAATETVVEAVETPVNNLPASPDHPRLPRPASQPSPERRRAREIGRRRGSRAPRSLPQEVNPDASGCFVARLIRAIAIPCGATQGGKLAYCMMHSISSPCSCIDRALRSGNAR